MVETCHYHLQFPVCRILPDTPTQHPDRTIFPSTSPEVWWHGPPLPGCPRPHLGVLLGHMLLGELGQLHELGDDLLDVVAVGAVHQGGGHREQDGLVRGLGGGGTGWGGQQGNGRNEPSEQTSASKTAPSLGPMLVWAERVADAAQRRASRSRTEGGERGPPPQGAPSTAPLTARVGVL